MEDFNSNSNVLYEVENFLDENYRFRKNVLSTKTEMLNKNDNNEGQEKWIPITLEVMNTIVRNAKKENIGGKKSPRKDIEEYIHSDAIELFNPSMDYLNSLPEWDGKNHVALLFNRIPGITTEQLSWCSIWIRSCVAHWMGMDVSHGNECVPVLIGEQGCGKSTFVIKILPPHLREYYLDHINFGNKFDCEMALTNNLLVNIDEFTNITLGQQLKLKQTLSKVKVNGRPIFGKCQEDRMRFASFIATTNDEHPLCDPTGSRRFLCVRVQKGKLIDNETSIDYAQLYAQIKYELLVKNIPYWFTNDEVKRIQIANLQFFYTDNLEEMIMYSYSFPNEEDDATWMSCNEVASQLMRSFPKFTMSNSLKIRIGQTLKYLGCKSKHTKKGVVYKLLPIVF